MTTISTDATDLNTLRDPRSPSPRNRSSRTASPAPGQVPDLSGEVAALSTKLIDAINHQTTLDDALQNTRHELEIAREKLTSLEAAVKEHERLLNEGLLVEKAQVDKLEARLQGEIRDESDKRNAAESTKKSLELEVENLTASLFEEANTMVATARQEREAAEKKNEQMQIKLTETETLLSSHQEQLRNLKTVMQEIRSERSWTETSASVTAPSTPVQSHSDNIAKAFDNISPLKNQVQKQAQVQPENPLYWSHLIHPIMRMDTTAFDEFMSLLRTNRQVSGGNRSSSGGSGLNVVGLGSKDGSRQSSVVAASNNSTATTNTPGAFVPSPVLEAPSPTTTSTSALKDSKFYKRSLLEDVDPTLRLETAPGLSWMARRSVVSSMMSGSFIVDPFPTTYKFFSPAFTCSLCGDARQDEPHLRTHRFRLNENEESQRYPVCDYCLNRVRSTCDFLNFLRLVLRGQWRNETLDDCRAAWEECIRLKERMFWSRLGAGVVPVEHGNHSHEHELRPTSDGAVEGSVFQDVKAENAVESDLSTSAGALHAVDDVDAGESTKAPNTEAEATQAGSEAPLDTIVSHTNMELPPDRDLVEKRKSSTSPARKAIETFEAHSRPASARRDSSPTKAGSAALRLRASTPETKRHSSPSPSRSITQPSGSKKYSLVASLASKFQDSQAETTQSVEPERSNKESRPTSESSTVAQIPGAFG